MYKLTRGYAQHPYSIPAISVNGTKSANAWHFMNYVWTLYCHSAVVATGPAILVLRLSCTTTLRWTALPFPLPPGWAPLLWPWRGEGLESSHTLSHPLSPTGRAPLPPQKSVSSEQSVCGVSGCTRWEWEWEWVPNSEAGRGGRGFPKRREQCQRRNSRASGGEEDLKQTQNNISCCSSQEAVKCPRYRSQPAGEVCCGSGERQREGEALRMLSREAVVVISGHF